MHRSFACLSLTLAIVVGFTLRPPLYAQPAPNDSDRPRLLVLTDIGGDPDDQQSLIRLLLYANTFSIEGLIASASGTPGELGQAVTRPDLIRQIIDAYAQVQSNLKRHSPTYPPADKLHQVVKAGNPQRGRDAIGSDHDTEGSRWIIRCLDRPDSRPLNITIWGGQTDLAQALWRIREDRGITDFQACIRKLRVFDIADQDGLAHWINREFPDLFTIVSKARPGQDKRNAAFRGMYLGGDTSITSRAWLQNHVLENHGPLGALYPTRTWTAPNPHGALKEGDTPSWFYFLPNGLGTIDQPNYGSWGGRYELEGNHLYRDAPDTIAGSTDLRCTVSRWRPAFQNAFRARLDWCIAEPQAANHEPHARLNGTEGTQPLRVLVSAGDVVELDATQSSDPDGDPLSFRWWFYPEPSTHPISAQLVHANSSEAQLLITPNTALSETHVVLEVTDQGTPPLTAYRRIIINVPAEHVSSSSLPTRPSAWPGADWPTRSPSELDLDPDLLRQARDYALTGGGSGMIVRRGYQVLAWGDLTKRYDLKSTTKSFGCIALGLAVDDGLVQLDDRALKHHPHLGVPPEANRQLGWIEQITLRHLASQTAGFEKPGGYTPILFEPGTEWDYSDSGPNWLAECLTLQIRRDLNDWMFERVFTPLGITQTDLTWRRNAYRPAHIEKIPRREFGAGIHANVDALARIGLLMLREGIWKESQILDPAYIRLATATSPRAAHLKVRHPETYANASAHYGLLWWNNADRTLKGVPRDIYWSWGLYDSLIVVMPSLDLVVARAGKSWERQPNSQHYDVLHPFFLPIVQATQTSPGTSPPIPSRQELGDGR